jgi:succinate dehydrogenase/fumarate reductase cytochrome b subunit
MRRVHYISGLTLTIFIGAHLFNHFCSIYGVESHINIMNTLRIFYRNIFIEAILITAVLVQVLSGIKLYRESKKIVTNKFEKLHVLSGLYLAFFLLLHVTAVFSGRLFLHLDTNFYFGVAGLNSFPFNLFFIPYYGLSILAFFGHISAIHYKKMTLNILDIPPQKQASIIFLIGILLTVVIFYGLTNHFHGVSLPKEYKEFNLK